jgi:hypothetical protein
MPKASFNVLFFNNFLNFSESFIPDTIFAKLQGFINPTWVGVCCCLKNLSTL